MMPLPLAPIATIALRYSFVAMTAYVMARKVQAAPRDQRAEDALDDVPEGIAARTETGGTAGTARLRRTVRLGRNGPGVEIDATALGRLRLRRVKSGG